jgi:phosphoribosyl-ATP pyrophosphohydrolase
MARREHMLGIAEKLPKSTVKTPKAVASMPKAVASRVARRPIVALESRNLRKRH